MLERFTDEARRVLVLAQEEARTLCHNHIGTEHILLGVIHEGGDHVPFTPAVRRCSRCPCGRRCSSAPITSAGASLRRCSTVSARRLNRSDASSAT